MRKIIVSSQTSMDAVIDNPQNFVFDYINDEFMNYAREQLFESDALIMGRVTYEGFAEAWSARAGAEGLRGIAGVTYLGDNSKARRELGYNPRPLKEGLAETLQHEMRLLGMQP